MKWRSSLLLIRMEWSIRLSDELNRKHMEWAILCVFGFSFWGTELMCFQIGHILKKNKGNIQKTGYPEKEDMKWNGKLDIK